jgi:hypothetical protein
MNITNVASPVITAYAQNNPVESKAAPETSAVAILPEIPSSPAGGGSAPLGEIMASPPTAVLKDDGSSGNLYASMAASVYALNHSFDEQKAALSLIA